MTLKRTFELAVGSNDGASVGINHNDEEPPVKRRLSSVPRTPFSERSSLSVAAQTPFTGTPYPSRPLDSPTNPLGRRCIQNLTHTLPPPTSFGKHLPLRFQFVRPGVSPRMGGVYRVVQAPLSYTFVHLRRLIAFLYGGGIGEDRHLFEVKKKMMMHAITYKPGQIKHGFTAVKLSTARDPCRYKPEDDENTIDDDFMQGEDNAAPSQVISDSEESGDEEPSWKWELEEEFTLGHVWSKGIDLSAGIIYHHDETTAVHITINTTSLPRRHGHSNIPYVFSARGRVRIYPTTFLPLPKPIFSVPIRKLFMTSLRNSDWSTSAKVDERDTENEDEGTEEADKAEEEKAAECEDLVDENGDSGLEVGDARLSGFLRDENESNGNEKLTTTDEEEEEEEEDEPDDPSIFLDVKKFNAPHAFATYLRFVHQYGQRCQYPLSDDSDDEDEDDLFHLRSTPTLVHTSSSPMSSPIPSSSTVFSSSPFVSPERCRSIPYDPYLASLSTLTSLSSATYTPVPAHASWQVRRFERVRRRMDKCKKKAWMSSEDDEVEDVVGQLAGDAQGQKPADARDNSRPTVQDGLNDEKTIPLLPLWREPQMKMDDISNPFVDELEV